MSTVLTVAVAVAVVGLAALLVSGVVFAVALVVAYRNGVDPDWSGPPQPLTFDPHAAVAAALLQPDQPILTADQEALLHADLIPVEAEQYLRHLTSGES